MTRVAIVGGARTAFVKAGGVFADRSFLELGIHVVESTVDRLGLDPAAIDELVFGTVLLDPRTPNAARELVLRSKLPDTLSAHFVSNNCITGLVAANMIADGIRSGRIRRGIAAGAESMSRPALTLSPDAERFYISLFGARKTSDRLKRLKDFRINFVLPQPPSPKEPSTGLTMGQHCELMAKEFSIDRTTPDEIALRSHQNGARAQAEGRLAEEVVPLNGVERDNIIRPDTSIEKLSKLPPVFDRSGAGTLTAGNSSPLTDGASAVCLMSEEAAKEEGREILGFLDAMEFAAIPPGDGLLMAPGLALPRLLQRERLSLSDIDRFEIHEAFGAQVAANMKVWEHGWEKYPELRPVGKIPLESVNVNGGSIAIGHPFAATGGRLLLSTCNELKRSNTQTAVISVCAAGAMGAVALVRRT